jgi:hypothetical protein
MAEQRTLWGYLEDGGKDEYEARADRERSRRQTFKRLRASGHWLTLLRVARTIPQPFTLNDVSVAVWRAQPEFFGMKGYPFPDNHKVHYILYGSRGLIAKGIILRVRQGLFRVADGIDPEELLHAEPEGEAVGPPDDPGACCETEDLTATARRSSP